MDKSGKKAILSIVIIAGICLGTVSIKNFIFNISKRTMQFTPQALPEGSSFKYDDLVGEISIVRVSNESVSIEGMVTLLDSKEYEFIKTDAETSNKCHGYVIFEYDNLQNLVTASSTPNGSTKYTPDSLNECFNATIQAISTIQKNKNEVINGDSWRPSKIDNLFK